MNLIDRIPATHFKPIQLRDELLWEKYEFLSAFIHKNFNAEFKDILAKPFATGDKYNWHSIKSGEFKTLDTFSLDQKQQILLKYHTMLLAVREKENELRSSANLDNLIWAEMLALTFSEQENIIYSNGVDIVLIWGFKFSNSEENHIDTVLLANYIDQKINSSVSLNNYESQD